MKRIALFAFALAFAGVVQATEPTIDWSQPVSCQYDGSGNIRQIGGDAYRYDTAGRLVRAHTNGVRRDYSYDAYGNRLTCAHDPATDCQYGHTINSATNRVNQAGYDAAGRVGSYLNHTYSYDAVNMPVLDDGPFEDRELIYTADDERLAVYTVGKQSAWHWTIRDASGKVLRELRSTNAPDGTPGAAAWTWERDHVWRDGQLTASRQMVDSAPTTYHYHLDHLGTARRVTDANDHIVGAHDYYPFGTETSGSASEPSATSLKYAGHERDGASADPATLDYMHARYYSAALGRFLSVDPAGSEPSRPQSWNRYAYVGNDPLNNIDPDGRETVSSRGATSLEEIREVRRAIVDGVLSPFDSVLHAAGRVGRQQGEGIVDGLKTGKETGEAIGRGKSNTAITIAASHDVRRGLGLALVMLGAARMPRALPGRGQTTVIGKMDEVAEYSRNHGAIRMNIPQAKWDRMSPLARHVASASYVFRSAILGNHIVGTATRTGTFTRTELRVAKFLGQAVRDAD